jgi:hypothetical protein
VTNDRPGFQPSRSWDTHAWGFAPGCISRAVGAMKIWRKDEWIEARDPAGVRHCGPAGRMESAGAGDDDNCARYGVVRERHTGARVCDCELERVHRGQWSGHRGGQYDRDPGDWGIADCGVGTQSGVDPDGELLHGGVPPERWGDEPRVLHALEMRVDSHERSVQRMKGLGAAFGALLTMVHLAIAWLGGRR